MADPYARQSLSPPLAKPGQTADPDSPAGVDFTDRAASAPAYARPATEVACTLGVDPERGLSEREAAERLERLGPNDLLRERGLPAWLRFLNQFNDPLIYLLLGAVVISLVAWWIEGASGAPVDAIVIALIVVLNAIIGFVQEDRAAKAVAALQSMSAPHTTVLRDGTARSILSSELVEGDVLLLEEGATIAADGRILAATNLLVAEAALTGESAPVEKSTAPVPVDTPLAERTDMVFAGTGVSQGVGRAVVTATAMRTEMGDIADMLRETRSGPTPLEREIGFVGKMLSIVVIAIAIIVMTTVYLVTSEHSAASLIAILLLGVSLAVAAVPEGLPAILSLVLAMGVQRMAAHHAIVKKLSSVETLGSATVICTDKTGTLTKNVMTIERIVTPDDDLDLDRLGDAAAPEQALAVVHCGAIANNAQVSWDEDGRVRSLGDPTEAAFHFAMHALERKPGGELLACAPFPRRVREVPFSSARKMMSVVVEHADGGLDHLAQPAANGCLLASKGAPDVLLGRCTTVRTAEGVVELDQTMREGILGQVEALSSQAYRMLGVAVRADVPDTELDGDDDALEHDLTWLGMVAIIDPPREEVADAIAEAQSAGVRIVMITGDHPRTGARIAADLGIVGETARAERSGAAGAHFGDGDALGGDALGGDAFGRGPWPAALTGAELDALDDAAFGEAVQHVSVYARVAPRHKLRIVKALQQQGNVVAMTGDGVNDAPALKTADIGIAMGITGTEVTKEAAKIVLADDNFASIVRAIREGRGIFENIRKFLRYLLSSNMGEVMTMFFGVALFGVFGLADENGAMILPLLAVQILWINLLTDSAPALALGVDPIGRDVMTRPSRKRTDRIIDGKMWFSVMFIGALMATVTLVAIDIALPGGLFEGSGTAELGWTMAFTTLVFAQLFNTVNCRSDETSAFVGLFHNLWLWGAMALSLLLQIAVVHIPLLNAAFRTTPLDAGQWLICLLLASVVLWLDEARKIVARLKGIR